MVPSMWIILIMLQTFKILCANDCAVNVCEKMASPDDLSKSSSAEEEKKFPAVAAYSPYTVTDVCAGDIKKWCTCGLSTNQPWCDGKHKGTGFRSLKWVVPHQQDRYSLCMCKHTKSPPYCDGTHNYLPLEVIERQKCCRKNDDHKPDCKLCTGCGWVPDF